ncbi:hypothetical protein [Nicoliella lavandulae]|uniref:Uncharacterized protein n=1 Tax=Nicoliella lavandulae TaxID=3082954 RepID=A0ABU8SM69_9LACO
MKLKSLVVTDDIGNFENVEMKPASSNIQSMFPDFKVWEVIDSDGDIYYVNSLYISTFQIENSSEE